MGNNPETFNLPNNKDGEPIKVELFPVEHLIPDIKAEHTEAVHGVDYKSNDFEDAFVTEFISQVLSRYTDDQEVWPILQERLTNQVVVDLGANNSLGYFLSLILGAKGYIGVDKFHHKALEDRLRETTSKSIEEMIKQFGLFSTSKTLFAEGEKPEPKKDLIPASVVSEDMLSFLQRLPNDSVSIFTFGITYEIITPTYSEAVSKEIQRVLNRQGIYITDNSSIPSNNLKTLANELIKKGIKPLLMSFLKQQGFFVKSEECL